jgi:hypothetical protein
MTEVGHSGGRRVTIRALACDQTLRANFKAIAEHRINYRLLRAKKSSNKASYLLEQAAFVGCLCDKPA